MISNDAPVKRAIMRVVPMIALLLGSLSASAQGMSVYTGLGVGAFDHENPAGGSFSDTVSAWKLYGGVQLTEYFGLEVARGETSTLDGGAGSPLRVGVRSFATAHQADFTLTTLKLMGYLPLDWGALWLGVGVFKMAADVDITHGSFGRRNLSVRGEDEMAALGVEWRLDRLGRSIDLRLEYEWLNFPYADASTISFGVAYRFTGL